MSTETPNTKICPTCGTRLSEKAARCQVCGTQISQAVEIKSQKNIQASKMPEITLNLPAVLGLFVIFLAVGGILVFFALRALGPQASGEAPVNGNTTPTMTLTITPTPTETGTPTPMPTATTQPPREYTIASGDTCLSIALGFDVSVQSIILMNNLPVACNTLRVGDKLLVPYPTPTPLPAATATLLPADATRQACEQVTYTVQEGDTLSTIAATYAVPQDAIKEFNGLTTDTVFLGLKLVVPLCRRAATPGPSPTPTLPPPYPAPNLLLPADGASFTLSNDTITLQWASVGSLRENEAYEVTVIDVTDAQGRKLVDYVRDTKFIVPTSFRPEDTIPHVMRWYVTPVRQTGSDEQGQPIWTSAGSKSQERVFSWVSSAVAATPTP